MRLFWCLSQSGEGNSHLLELTKILPRSLRCAGQRSKNERKKKLARFGREDIRKLRVNPSYRSSRRGL
jgi:hypothetical protein